MSKRESIGKIWYDDPGHISKLIFKEMETYAKDYGFYPVQFALYKYMAEPQWNEATCKMDPARYPDLTMGTFDHWYGRLKDEGYIAIDKRTRAVRMAHLVITDKDGSEVPD